MVICWDVDPGEYCLVSDCDAVIVQVPAATAVTFPRESIVQTEAGPTVIEMGVDVLFFNSIQSSNCPL